MAINRKKALRVWEEQFGDVEYACDFHGRPMFRSAYNDPNAYFLYRRARILCGWNIHHVLPKGRGGNDTAENLICTNIQTNEEAAEKITFWIEDSLYQVKCKTNGGYTVERIN